METKDIILELRNNLYLSQEAFADKLMITRQAVSRWEQGETIPTTDSLKLISKAFDVSIDYLLGNTTQCQSCGMELIKESDKGTNSDGKKVDNYCSFCYEKGKFVHDSTMEEMIEHNLKDLDEWNKDNNLHLTKEDARNQLLAFLPTLERWK